MATTTATSRSSGAWVRIAFAMFAVGWGANQFSPMLIVYRHELGLSAGAVAGLFLVYALTLIPGLLVGGPASDRFGRRPVVWPFVALSPLATLLLVLGPRSLVMIAIGRALAGLCSGVVFGAATAWVQEVSPDDGMSARRSALALTAGFGLGPVVAAVRTRRFWLAVAPGSPMVFGSVSLAIVVLPEEVTSARSLSAGFAGLMTVLSFSAGVAVQPLAR
jgi:MFS family permease